MAKENNIAAEIEEAEKKIKSSEKKVSDPWKEKVTINIPMSEQEQDDWFCCINGKTFLVQRGVPVIVPRCVKEVYDNQVRMNQESIRRSRALQQKMVEKEKLAFR